MSPHTAVPAARAPPVPGKKEVGKGSAGEVSIVLSRGGRKSAGEGINLEEEEARRYIFSALLCRQPLLPSMVGRGGESHSRRGLRRRTLPLLFLLRFSFYGRLKREKRAIVVVVVVGVPALQEEIVEEGGRKGHPTEKKL